MEFYKSTLTFLGKGGSEERKDEEKAVQYVHTSKEDILVGGDPKNNVRITDAEATVCRIYVNSSQKVSKNFLSLSISLARDEDAATTKHTHTICTLCRHLNFPLSLSPPAFCTDCH
jgi:hypothetical protein